MRYEEIETDLGRTYFRYWENGLKTILGWPSSEVEIWAEKFRDDLNGNNGIFYHYHPGEYIVPALLPSKILQAAAERGLLVKVLREVADSVSCELFPELWRGAGWEEAKARADAVLLRIRKEYSE